MAINQIRSDRLDLTPLRNSTLHMAEAEAIISKNEHEERFLSRRRFIYAAPEGFFTKLDELSQAERPIRPALLAFRANLSAAIEVGSIPYRLANASVLDQILSHFVSAENIRQLNNVQPGENLSDDHRRDALRIAKERFDREYSNPERVLEAAKATLRLLDRHLTKGEFSSASDELLRQVLVISWERLKF